MTGIVIWIHLRILVLFPGNLSGLQKQFFVPHDRFVVGNKGGLDPFLSSGRADGLFAISQFHHAKGEGFHGTDVVKNPQQFALELIQLAAFHRDSLLAYGAVLPRLLFRRGNVAVDVGNNRNQGHGCRLAHDGICGHVQPRVFGCQQYCCCVFWSLFLEGIGDFTGPLGLLSLGRSGNGNLAGSFEFHGRCSSVCSRLDLNDVPFVRMVCVVSNPKP
mmetsp:Transcript_19945/g.43365  ORF Transcript_19945/g.43365 Transcript_19945/m.43365 type:complete len:217 (+) Transcript_19945:944-1594(+)